MKTIYAILDEKGRSIAIASSIEKVNEFISNFELHKQYESRKRDLELQRREFIRKHLELTNDKDSVTRTKINEEIANINKFISENNKYRSLMTPELAKLNKKLSELNETKLKEAENRKELTEKFVNSLGNNDRFIWDGDWSYTKGNHKPSYKLINYIG